MRIIYVQSSCVTSLGIFFGGVRHSKFRVTEEERVNSCTLG